MRKLPWRRPNSLRPSVSRSRTSRCLERPLGLSETRVPPDVLAGEQRVPLDVLAGEQQVDIGHQPDHGGPQGAQGHAPLKQSHKQVSALAV